MLRLPPLQNPQFNGMRPQIILLRDGTDTSQGKGQLISNINACQAVVEAVRTTLGPRGMDKLVVAEGGKVSVGGRCLWASVTPAPARARQLVRPTVRPHVLHDSHHALHGGAGLSALLACTGGHAGGRAGAPL